MHLQKHRELYTSINKYSKDIVAEDEYLSPLTVLKTAIQLHQRHPARATSPGTYSNAPHALMPEVSEKQSSYECGGDFESKLANLKSVLPFASEVKLASLLNREKGNMNAAVQRILDDATSYSSDEEKEIADSGMDGASPALIDLTADASNTDEYNADSTIAAVYPNIMQGLSVDMLENIMKTVQENETEQIPPSNMISFHRPEKSHIDAGSFSNAEENSSSRLLSDMHSKFLPKECPFCFRSFPDGKIGAFCEFCGGIIDKKYCRL